MGSGFQVEPGELTGLAGTLGAAADVITNAASGLTAGAGGDLGRPELNAAVESFGAGWRELMDRLAGVTEQLSDAVSAAGQQYVELDRGVSTPFGGLAGLGERIGADQ
ncbi:WXG100 family type VII secretion target [Actinophytocola sp.]|uniref:WXG100 family type VII secretion target n=1 Tax=Actinophytocola sp. TaxID=1872138 RepID=UPI003D6B41FE